MLRLFRLSFCSLLLVSVFFALSSCSTFDPPVVVPAYGHIDSIHFAVPPDSATTEGSSSSKITAAWVYLDDNPVGAFQMPCTFPIVAGNGQHNIKIYSGVNAAGSNTAYAINPFYQFYSVNVNLQQGKTTKLQPASSYYNWVKFEYIEDFENQAPGSPPKDIINYYGDGVASAASQTTMTVINSPKSDVFQGQSGMVVLNQAKNYYIGITDPYNSLPTNGTPVYLELNYKTTTLFSIGLFEDDSLTQISPTALVYPTSTWTKLYVDLYTNSISTYHQFPNYRVYFAMQFNAGDVSDTLLLDNIKILY
jgi:hypothetical protein